jgi:hypothetical protein
MKHAGKIYDTKDQLQFSLSDALLFFSNPPSAAFAMASSSWMAMASSDRELAKVGLAT